jgi:hypothetical protein
MYDLVEEIIELAGEYAIGLTMGLVMFILPLLYFVK